MSEESRYRRRSGLIREDDWAVGEVAPNPQGPRGWHAPKTTSGGIRAAVALDLRTRRRSTPTAKASEMAGNSDRAGRGCVRPISNSPECLCSSPSFPSRYLDWKSLAARDRQKRKSRLGGDGQIQP